MSHNSGYDILLQEKNDKHLQILNLYDEYYTILREHSLTPEYDPDIGEWSPDKETGLRDVIRIEEQIRQLNHEIRSIGYKLRHSKSGRR